VKLQTYGEIFEGYEAQEKRLAVLMIPHDGAPAKVWFTLHYACAMKHAARTLPATATWQAYPFESLNASDRLEAERQPCGEGTACSCYRYGESV
jgi:hypothetical protein